MWCTGSVFPEYVAIANFEAESSDKRQLSLTAGEVVQVIKEQPSGNLLLTFSNTFFCVFIPVMVFNDVLVPILPFLFCSCSVPVRSPVLSVLVYIYIYIYIYIYGHIYTI